ncbi:MAG: peptidase C14, caspase catalytic subunit p20 [Magnetococcales bacterium]|nr:peptidase C14, caspase catalytic subunit p20 [Magnetococcales bacterium]
MAQLLPWGFTIRNRIDGLKSLTLSTPFPPPLDFDTRPPITFSRSAGGCRSLHAIVLLAAWILLNMSQPSLSWAEISGSCTVAREIIVKGIERFDNQRDLAITAIQRASDMCQTDPSITFNLGLALYLDKQLPKAREIWETLYKTTKELPATDRLAMKVHTNLAWLRFEMGDDEEAHLLAFEGVKKYPGNLPLAHTKFMSLARQGRYLEVYDWLTRERLPGSLPVEWKQQAAEYMVENLWRDFRSGKRLASIKNAVDFLIKEYPDEKIFILAKEQLLHAEVDPNGVIPPPIELPTNTWPKSGNVGDRVMELDPLLAALPGLDPWKKREDAFAVLVGIARYQKIESRHYGNRDAANMYTLLTHRGMFFADPDHTRLRTDNQATLETMQQDLEWLANKGKTHPNAVLLFYFSGLGSAWTTGAAPGFSDGLLLPVGVDGLNINPETSYSLNRLKGMLANLPDREIVVILDTCFHNQGRCGTRLSDRKALPTMNFFSNTRGWAVASLQGDAGFLDPARQGAFTYELIKGFLGQADGMNGTNRDGWVNLGEAFEFAQSRLKTRNPAPDGFLTAPASIRLTRIRGEQ